MQSWHLAEVTMPKNTPFLPLLKFEKYFWYITSAPSPPSPPCPRHCHLGFMVMEIIVPYSVNVQRPSLGRACAGAYRRGPVGCDCSFMSIDLCQDSLFLCSMMFCLRQHPPICPTRPLQFSVSVGS
uniref:Uncharacterized protein n=1 Tax=Eutreptiella gymnastica TaxID=73025 RepID=A0A7S1IKP7_9EUGL|mmetsp:Transcript_25891/g.46741  ORF Transcript_25891/g.46741 Transcript_25891/m.46741 type:complete len:126 (+) Transcript_25891:891-1268(+)